MMHSFIRAVSVLSFFLILSATAARAEAPFGVSLMRPDSLAGWEYGEAPIKGWAMVDGRLSGSADATPLLSGFTAGDFELRFHWSVAGGGALRLLLPEVPQGKGLELVLDESAGCGRLTDGDRELAPGAKVEPLPDKPHTAALRRMFGKFSLAVDGRVLYEVDIPDGRRFGLGLAVAAGAATISDLRAAEPLGNPIFSGVDLAGWWTPGKIAAWKAENGELVLQPGGGNYLRTEKLYGNFTLTLEYLACKNCNSGIGIRTPREGWPSGDGMELQIWDRPLSEPINQHSAMAIYGNVPPLGRADRSDQWNHVVIKADGPMISAWVNGELVQQYNTFDHPELEHRNLKGWIGIQDHGGWIRLRNLRVLESPDGTGLAAWQQPRLLRATNVLIDRLMNPERLSLCDGLVSGVATKSVSDDVQSEHVLAELSGPGAVVRIARTSDDGQLAFYFDGEEKPRIECRVSELRRALPPVAEDGYPLTTCLTYQKSLKIVLREAKQAEYRLDYVTFPKEFLAESFAGREAGFPRGWLSAVEYRLGQMTWGTHREHEPTPRINCEKKTIEAGKTEPMIHVDGAGVVQWVKLVADKRLLETNDLWLEVTIDGEPTPAVAAPVRFLFPGLVGQSGYANFVMLDRGGPTLRLAMPFSDGITIAAKNCGGQPIEGVGLSVSVEPATESTRPEIAARMRLRGAFQPAAEGTSEIVRREGTGRWVALIYDQPAGQETGLAGATIDARPTDGWAAADMNLFLGQSGDFRSALSGRRGGLCWRYLWLEPVEFQQSLVLGATGSKVGERLALFYLKK